MNEKSVLYVEDEVDFQLLVQNILGKAGIQVRLVGTGEEFFSALTERKPDLLILDVNLPDTNGYEICKRVRSSPEWANLPVLMLTVKRRPEEWLKAFASGADDYVAKPLNPPELITRVQSCMEWRKESPPAAGSAEYVLIQAAVGGNKQAFEVLIEQYRQRLVDNLKSLGRADSDSEDLASDAFSRAFQRLDRFRGQSSFYTWLYRIAVNESLRPRWRTWGPSIEEIDFGDETALPVHLSGSDRVEEDVSRQGVQQRLMQAVASVPKPYRQMLQWHFIQGVSCEKIAKRMKIPSGTVMSRLFRAKQLLRDCWGKTAT